MMIQQAKKMTNLMKKNMMNSEKISKLRFQRSTFQSD